MSILGLLIILLGTAAAVWARALVRPEEAFARRIALPVLRSIALGGAVLIIGALPWYYVEAASAPEKGAPFIFLFWIGVGPVISFGVLPGIYALVTGLNLPRWFKLLGFPALLAIPVTLYLVSEWMATTSPADRQQIPVFILLFDVTTIAGWLVYFGGMEIGRESPGAV